MVNLGGSSVSILLNNGQWGTPGSGSLGFDSPVNYPLGGTESETIAAGDFNGDGYLDLFIGNGDNSLSVLLASAPTPGTSAQGTFLSPALNYPGLGGSFGMVEADFNGDSVPDLAVVGYNNALLQTNILLGGTESVAPTASLYDLTVPGTGPTQVTGTYAPSPANWGPSAGSTTVRSVAVKAAESLTINAPTYVVYPNSTGSFQVFFNPAAGTPGTVPPPTGSIALTATLGNVTIPAPNPNPYLVQYCYTPVYSNGCPVSISFPTAGTWTITATYGGDNNWAPASSTSSTFTVVKAGTSLVFSNPNPSAAVAGSTFNAQVLLNLIGFQVPTGNVNFTATNGAQSVLVPSQLASTLGNNYGFYTSIPIVFPSAGTWTVTANYQGDNLFSGSAASLTVNVTGSVCPSGATLSVSPSSTSVGAGQTLQLTATVTGVTGPVVSWTISPSTFGSIVSTGPTTSTYTAPTSAAGVVQILASLSSCTSGPAVIDTVTITSAPPPQQATPPAFSPAPGSYSGVKNVLLSSTPGATIYYTLDGSPATTSSTVYSGPIPLSANQTINAIAGGTGFNSSVMVSGRYSFFAQSGAIIPGTLSAYIPTTPVGTVPSDVVFDAAGNFYVLDSGLGTITKFAAGTSTGGTVIVPTGTLSNPQFFTVGVDGQTLFVSDYGNNRIVTVSQATSPATVTPLTTNIPPPSTPCAAFPTATLCQPTGIFVDSRANLLVADSGNHRVLQLTSTGTYVKTLLDKTIYAGTLQTFFGIAEDNAGNVFVANAPAASSMGGGSLLLLTPSGTAGIAPIVNFKPQSPYGVTADPSGNIYVSDQYAKKIYEYLAGTYSAYIVAGGQGTNGPTTTDSGDGGPATIGTLAGPLGIALDSNYNVYVSDANAQAFQRRFDSASKRFTRCGELSQHERWAIRSRERVFHQSFRGFAHNWLTRVFRYKCGRLFHSGDYANCPWGWSSTAA